MKYIRTKSFITNFEDWMEINGSLLSIGAVKYIIIAQADTIEELCDEFVQETNCFGDKPIVIKSNTFSTIIGIAKEYTVYGAIWTDTGLIYVAKLNDKGEFELL